MKKIFSGKVFDVLPLSDGIIFSYCKDVIDENTIVSYKMISFSASSFMHLSPLCGILQSKSVILPHISLFFPVNKAVSPAFLESCGQRGTSLKLATQQGGSETDTAPSLMEKSSKGCTVSCSGSSNVLCSVICPLRIAPSALATAASCKRMQRGSAVCTDRLQTVSRIVPELPNDAEHCTRGTGVTAGPAAGVAVRTESRLAP